MQRLEQARGFGKSAVTCAVEELGVEFVVAQRQLRMTPRVADGTAVELAPVTRLDHDPVELGHAGLLGAFPVDDFHPCERVERRHVRPGNEAVLELGKADGMVDQRGSDVVIEAEAGLKPVAGR